MQHRIALVALAALSLTACTGIASRLASRPAHAPRLPAATDALDRAEPLCHALDPAISRLSVDLVEAIRTDGRTQRIWEIEGSDPDAPGAIHALYDLDTGDLLSVRRSRILARRGDALPAMSPRQAKREAARWMRATGMIAQADRWRLAGPPKRLASDLWRVCWQAEDRFVVVQMDARTGDLASALTTDLPPCAPSWLLPGNRGAAADRRAAGAP